MSARALAIGVALLAVGFLLGSIWNQTSGSQRAAVDRDLRPIEFEPRRVREVDPVTDEERPSRPRLPSVVSPVAEPLVPQPGAGRAKIAFDFRSLSRKSWFGCLAVVEGTGLDGTRLRHALKPYPDGIGTFDLPAGRWRVTWRTSAQLRDQRGRMVRLTANQDVRIDASADPGDPIKTWIWPGLGMLEIVVLAPTGKPLAGAPVVVVGRALRPEAERIRTTTDWQGRCRLEFRPGRFEVFVGWMHRGVSTIAGEVVEVRMDGRETGSLVVLSDRQEASRLRLVGTKKWRRPSPVALGDFFTKEQRFDLLPPGEYEVAVERGSMFVGTATVRNGAETRFQVGPGR